MYHGRFNGTHYEIGFKWGALLSQHGNFILNNVGFPITQERLEFSASCVPVYQKYFPEILEEIQGTENAGNGIVYNFSQAKDPTAPWKVKETDNNYYWNGQVFAGSPVVAATFNPTSCMK